MAYIESQQSLGRHPKTKAATRLLDISKPQLIGHLHFLWWWALDFAQDGDLSRYDPADLEDEMLWEGKPGQLVAVLEQVGFLERRDDGLAIHDWYDYAGRLIELREANRERMRERRASNKEARADNVQRTTTAQPDNVWGYRTKPNLSNQTNTTVTSDPETEPENQPSQAATAVAEEEEVSRAQPKTKPALRTQAAQTAFQEFWDAYPTRNGKRLGRKQAEIEFAKLTPDDWPIVLQAVKAYAVLCDPKKQGARIPRDAERFLRAENWRDMAETEREPTPIAQRGGGKAYAEWVKSHPVIQPGDFGRIRNGTAAEPP